jgi:hypothetical protein
MLDQLNLRSDNGPVQHLRKCICTHGRCGVRRLPLESRLGVTVRFTMAGVTSLRRGLPIYFTPHPSNCSYNKRLATVVKLAAAAGMPGARPSDKLSMV